jgi:hypothetical protein
MQLFTALLKQPLNAGLQVLMGLMLRNSGKKTGCC